jgi:hypothetical protein
MACGDAAVGRAVVVEVFVAQRNLVVSLRYVTVGLMP